jgi:glycosyltransferase involved in cell wall biosynthesis
MQLDAGFNQDVKSLRIAILTPVSVAKNRTGAWMQASKTSKALRALGLEVEHILYGETSEHSRFHSHIEAGKLLGLAGNKDILHFIPSPPRSLPLRRLDRLRDRRPVLAVSPVYWSSCTHHAVIAFNSHYKLRRIIKAGLKEALSHIAPFITRYEEFDLLLPNSRVEAQLCSAHFRLKKTSLVRSVPNGIDPVPRWAKDASAPTEVHEIEYILYPGVFTARKNQLGFIRAMREEDVGVVFMGGPLNDSESRAYFDRCREEAPGSWLFLGHVPHASPEFYGLMGNARVACLASSCETPGIALLEAACLGVRPAVTKEGSALEYFGQDAEYLNPLCGRSIRAAVQRAWHRGPLSDQSANNIRRLSWMNVGQGTLRHYIEALEVVAGRKP